MTAVARTVAGRYRLLEHLGSGGMGTVWRAHDAVLGRDVAVKEVTFPAGLSDQERDVLRERTRREARAAARLHHQSAVTVYDVVEEDDTPYLVMELVEARTLADVVRDDGPLGPRRTAEVGLAVLGALQAAHEQGIVHRDVKPSNVLLQQDGRVVLTDFGIASSFGDPALTSTGMILGSPSYISPERARGDAPSPASDLWSLGATLFTAVEGRPPHDKGEALPTLTAVILEEHEPFVAAGPLAPLLDGLLEKDPAQRLPADRASAALHQVLASGDAADVAPTAPLTEPGVRKDRTQALSLGAVADKIAHEQQAAARHASEPAVPAHPVPHRSRVLLAVGALVLALAVSIPLLLRSGSDDPDRRAAAGPATSSSARPEASASSRTPAGSTSGGSTASSPTAAAASAGPAPAAGVVPAGWTTREGDGWTVAVPASYRDSTFNASPQYSDDATGRTLRVSTTAPGGGKADAVQDRRDQAAAFAQDHADYEELSLGAVDFRGYDAADWEFTYSDDGAALHALSRVFVVDGRGYSLFFQTRSGDDWSAAREVFEQMAAAFQP